MAKKKRNKEKSDKLECLSSQEEIEKAFSDLLSGEDLGAAAAARKLIEDNFAFGRQSRYDLFRNYMFTAEIQQEARDMLDKMGAPINFRNEILSPAKRFRAWQHENDEKNAHALELARKEVSSKYNNAIFNVVTFLLALLAFGTNYLWNY